MTRVRAVRRLTALLFAPWLAAQEPVPGPEPRPAPQESPVAVDPAVVRAGEALLRAHGERTRGVSVLVADYEQTRTTQLAKEPLRSRGRFLFVRRPACVVFRASEPRESIVRLRGTTYEVFRPQRRRLERFHLDGPELAQSLFAVIGGDTERLLREFAVVACGPDPADAARRRVVLAPRHDAVRERLRELRVLLRADDGGLAAVAYRDPSGDLVEIALHRVEPDPEQPPSADFEVPADTTVVEHRPPPRER